MAVLRQWLAIAGLLGLVVCGVIPAAAQNAAPNAAKNEPPKLPEPEDISRETKDGVALRMTYFPGTLGKKSVPVILLHGWGGQRGDLEGLARLLQSYGYTCLTIDMRGHGQSLKIKGVDKEIDREKFVRNDLRSMSYDIEAGKKFLLEKNNAGECNIEALGIVACDVMCTAAMQWSIADWAAPVLPAFKQGQDVKALVLLSPSPTFKGFEANDFFTNQVTRKQLSVMLVSGSSDAKSYAETKRLHTKLQGFHPKPTNDPETDKKNQDLFMVTPDTELQGSKLINKALPIANNIANFLKLRLVEKQDTYSWTERKSPF
ncbi:alpha/beta hydrolase [Anatilimnocola floriformis]|uniref:alpha/beta hydrolase n=1 Tax=Anatilimnocola floriformis TaxID=2948575 RepID=UPI0020C4DB34|nr:alpha/beta hydrolase [Anatilimnocola floriformis]